MSQQIRAFVVVCALIGAVILPGFAFTPTPTVTERSVAAHAADCRVNVYQPYWHSGKIEVYTTFTCHAARYKLTAYVCGGVNGNGYCLAASEARCGVFSCSELTKYSSCTPQYQGPYWHYGGAKLQSQNAEGQWSSSYWTFGPGAWFSPGC